MEINIVLGLWQHGGRAGPVGWGADEGAAAILDNNVLAGAAIGTVGNLAYCQHFSEKCN
ncbi:MAG: hypothetical protein GDA36_07975 [Rhodobacteraceae bacterium]|nr:hypothetical protein [Paracoccaceae bacterium]